MTDPESIHDRLARLEAGVAAPVHRWWHHAFAATGIGAVLVILLLLAWLVSSVVDRYRRGKELLQVAQPVVVAQAVQHQLSEAELAAKYHLSTAVVRAAPKPGTKKRASSPATAGSTPGHPAPGVRGERAPSPSDQPEQVETTTYPEQQLPRLPYGGTALPALTGKPSEEPAFSLLVKGNPRPRFQLGGRRLAGFDFDYFSKPKAMKVFLEQDLTAVSLGSNDSCAAKSWRCGRALVLQMRPFWERGISVPPGEKATNYGVPITVAIDF